MKRFCILEQGCYINESLTLKKKALFNTEFSDFYRLNWQNPDQDPNSFIKDDFLKEKAIVWSEGRSLLYERVPKNYDYYIFVDDDIEFYSSGDKNIAVQIKEFLDEYKPITGTFYDPDQRNFALSGIDKETCISRKAFPIAVYDQQVQIFTKSFADLMFPAIYHGAIACMMYPQWLCYMLFPLKQICFSEVQVSNIRHKSDLIHGGSGYGAKAPQFYGPAELVWLFNRHVNDKYFFDCSRKEIQRINRLIFPKDVDKTEIEFTVKDLEKIYNINNFDYLKRTALADNSYMKRRYWNHLLWTWGIRLKSWKNKLVKSGL